MKTITVPEIKPCKFDGQMPSVRLKYPRNAREFKKIGYKGGASMFLFEIKHRVMVFTIQYFTLFFSSGNSLTELGECVELLQDSVDRAVRAWNDLFGKEHE